MELVGFFLIWTFCSLIFGLGLCQIFRNYRILKNSVHFPIEGQSRSF